MKQSFAKLIIFVIPILLFIGSTHAQTTVVPTKPFDKVIISPHIEVVFIEGDEETVTIENSEVSQDKINIEVNGKTLRVYLDDAKMVTKMKKVIEDGVERKRPIYRGTVVTATVTYRKLKALSLRGEETYVCESKLDSKKFRLKIFGESKVYMNEVEFEFLHTAIYGESYLEIKHGSIDRQKFLVYGESKINTLGVNNQTSQITAYGESDFKLKISEELRVTSFGEATVSYEGNPDIHKGIILGETRIKKMN